MTRTTAFILSVTFALTVPTPGITQTTTSGAGNTYYVAKTGSDSNSCAQAQSQSTPKLTINSGAGCLAAGDTLYVKAGTYNETLFDVIPSGTSWSNPTTVSAYPGDAVTIIGPASPTPRVIFFGSRQFVVLNGFILDGNNFNATAVIWAEEPNGNQSIRISNNEIKGGHSGIFGCSNCQIQYNNIHDNGLGFGEHGLYITGHDNLIEYNTVHHNASYGIHLFTYGNGDNNVIRYNDVDANNQKQSASAGILLANGNNNRAYNNIVRDTIQAVGIYGSGIDANYHCTNCAIYNNTIYNNGGVGVGVGDAPGLVVRNNIIFKNANGAIAGTLPAVQDHNLTTDPLFIDAANGNFSLKAGSPALNAGASPIATGVGCISSGSTCDIGANLIFP